MKQFTETQSTTDTADADLARIVQDVLLANRRGFWRISVGFEAGTVRLSGVVGSFFLRQSAIALAKSVAGVSHVVDDLEVDGTGISLKG